MHEILPMKPKPWKILSSQHLVQNHFISIRVDRCQLPTGQEIEPYFVIEYRPWVNVVAVTQENQVVLVRQYRHGLGMNVLELPGGTLDPGETSPMDAMQRELLEETGYQAENWVQIGKVSPNPAANTNYAYCFFASNARLVAEQHLDETEDLEVVLMPVNQVLEATRKGELLQAIHISSVFFALPWLEKHL